MKMSYWQSHNNIDLDLDLVDFQFVIHHNGLLYLPKNLRHNNVHNCMKLDKMDIGQNAIANSLHGLNNNNRTTMRQEHLEGKMHWEKDNSIQDKTIHIGLVEQNIVLLIFVDYIDNYIGFRRLTP